MNTYQSFIRKLTDVFIKKEDSNVGKLVLILSEKIDQLTDVFTKVEQWRDINLAEGKTLDLIGENIGQNRGQFSDELYRVLIKARIARNTSDGTFDSVINALARSINADPSKVRIRALYDEGKPASIVIEGIPVTELNLVGMAASHFGFMAQQVVASGIKIESIDLTGTFAYSSSLSIVEKDANGFANNEQTTGGTLGGTFEPVGSLPL